MVILIAGLALFLGIHSLRLFAAGFRARQVARLGEMRWKGLYALIALVGLALIVWGVGLARQQPVLVWVPPLAMRHLNALFTLVAFVLLAAAYVPRNHFKAWLGHPMVAGVKVWALGHLLATGWLHDLVLFGAFLVWAIVAFPILRRRDRAAGVSWPAGTIAGDVAAVAAGVLAWAVFAFWLHAVLIGMRPF